jgi:hypothetical protein
MKIQSLFFKVSAALWLCFGASGANAMHIGYLYPAGGRAGTTVEILVGGRALNGVTGVRVSGGGIKKATVERVPHMGHIPGPQKRWMTKYLKQIRAGNTEAPPRPEDTKEWRKHRYYDNLDKLSPLQLELVERNVFIPSDPLQKSPSIADMAIVKLEIAPDAAPGRREFRLVGRGQISDPLPFYIDTAPEVNEPRYTPPGVAHPHGEFKVPAVLNGQILPRESDFFDFSAAEGEVVTFSARARALVPFLGDGVPGHFQLVLEVWNADGRLVVSADDHYFDPDPVLVFRARKAGKYTLHVRDALYRGREDFVYRIRVRRGRPALQIPVPPEECGKWTEDPGEGKELQLPAFIRFKLTRPGSKIRRSFRAEAGQKLELEVLARCLGSPLDGRMTLYAPDGKILAEADDIKRPRIGTILHQADPRLEVAIPESGVYTVEAADASGTGGAESYGYLRIRPAEPDFQLYASPSGVSASVNSPAPVRVRAVRKNGFDGRIVLSTPPDSEIRLVGANALEPGMDEGVFTFVSRTWRKSDPVARPVRLIGISGGLMREAHPVDEAMQAFAYTHLVPAESFLAMQTWGSGHASRFSYVDPFRVLAAPRGGTDRLDLWMKPAEGIEIEYSLLDPPAGITIAEAVGERGMVRLTIRASESAAPGKYNLIPRISCKFKDKRGKRAVERFLLPAVRMEVTECPAK